MDTLLLVGGVSVVLVLVWAYMRASAAAAQREKSEATGQNWRTGEGRNMDPMLRNRHGIQNGETRYWTKAEVAKHNTADDLFVIIKNKVYDVTDFVGDHPGGDAIMRYPGEDCTEQFSGIQHPRSVWDLITDYYVGEVDKAEHVEYNFKVLSKL